MKQIFIVFLLFTMLISSASGQWNILNQGFSGFAEDADFVGEYGWITGHTSLYKSEDGGQNWIEIFLADDLQLNKIDFVNPQVGWAYGYSFSLSNNIVAFSDDGGKNWEVKHVFDTLYAYDIYAFSEDSVIVLGSTYVMKTNDGFENYQTTNLKTELAEFSSFDFSDHKIGAAVGGSYGEKSFAVILLTRDGGETWHERTDEGIRNISNIKFAVDSLAFFSAQDDSGRTLFCKTEDFFETWIIQRTKIEYGHYLIFPISADKVYSITSSYESTLRLLIEVSYNSGVNWTTLKELPMWGINYINFIGNTGYITGTVGGGGFISQPFGPLMMRSDDEGFNWDIKLFSYPFSDIQFLDNNHGFAVGGSMDIHHQAGEVFVTNDGGKSWAVSQTAGSKIPAIQFVNNQTGFYLVGSRGLLKKTINGAESWFNVYENNYDSTGISLLLYDFQFTDESNGWMVGEKYDESAFASIMKTNDGGEKWQFDLTTEGGIFKDIFLFDSQNGWAVGTEGLIARLQNGTWQTMPQIETPFLNKVCFSDARNGWTSGGFENMWNSDASLFRTSDGGVEWQKVENFNYVVDDIFFANNMKGWMVGADTLMKGVILYTENGGDSWQPLIKDLPGPLHAISFNEDFAWAAGDKGLVLRSNDGINWIEQAPNRIADFHLFQNYPNPFNPTTMIRYDVGANHDSPVLVELSIYNLLGQKVATLVDKKQTAGSYQVQWDASGLASGVYLYKLEIKDSPRRTGDGFSQTMKLILLK